MAPDLSNDPDFKAFAAHVHAHLIPMITDSTLSVSLVPEGEADIKYAIELGLSIMLDKPLVVAVPRGRQIPEHLARVADAIVEIDWEAPDGADKGKEQIAIEVQKILDGLEEKENRDQ